MVARPTDPCVLWLIRIVVVVGRRHDPKREDDPDEKDGRYDEKLPVYQPNHTARLGTRSFDGCVVVMVVCRDVLS